MNLRLRYRVLLLTSIYVIFLTLPLVADDQTDRLRGLAKQAKSEGRLDQVATYLCQAAVIDARKYEKHCERARSDASTKLQEFEGDLGTGKLEFDHKDYAGSIRDLKKILYGPHLGEAAQLIERAKALQVENADPTGMLLLQAAQTAYEHGSFDVAAAAASKVTAANLKPAATQILNNIKIYLATIAEAKALERHGDLKEAQDKYKFVLSIKANGPGNPTEGLQRIATSLAQQKLDAEKAQAAKPDPLALKKALAKAHQDEKQGNWKSALTDYDAVLSLDSTQAEATQGKQRILAQIRRSTKSTKPPLHKKDDSKDVVSPLANGANSEDMLEVQLEKGIQAFYASEFSEANQDLTEYLYAGGGTYKGAAHFYLAACLWSQVLLADPKDTHVSNWQQDAREHFRLAGLEKYKPIERFISPRILTEWKSMEQPQ